MSRYQFQLQAALPPRSALYVTRVEEARALNILRGSEPSFLLITEPRQQGKTSFLNYLLGHGDLNHCCFVSINAGPVNKNTIEEDWYRLISSEIISQLERYELLLQPFHSCTDHQSWRTQLIQIGKAALDQNRVVVIMIDEVGHLPQSWRETFFASICAVQDSRAFILPFRAITFIFSGSFRPEAMITDGNISPFNKAQPLALGDFNALQAEELLVNAGVPERLYTPVLARIYYWTDGQPYLLQQLASMVFEDGEERMDPERVDAMAHRLERTDKLLLPSIFSRIRTNRRWMKQVERVLNGEEIEFAPSSIQWQAELATLGIIKEEHSSAQCIIRNPIYARALRRLLLAHSEGLEVPDDRAETRRNLEALIQECKRRKQQRELQAVKLGIGAPPEIAIEIEDIDKQIARYSEQLAIL